MKIAIIGAGWVGCHLANKLISKNDVVLFEKNDKIFMETSYNNQNRLHLGFHYARNYETRELCKNTFNKFVNDYGCCVKEIKNNYYCIPKNKSIIDYKTYLKIFDDFNYEEVWCEYVNAEGCINTEEKFIDFKCCSNLFSNKLSKIIVTENVTDERVITLSKEFDLVIDATNNSLGLNKNSFLELTISLLYKKINQTEFDSLTLVDGNFFSIYPYYGDIYSLTDVKYTPIKKFKSIKKLNEFKNTINSVFVEKRKKLFENKVLKYYKNFKNDFVYVDYFLSIKSKIPSYSSSRYPVITEKDNIISCFTGKIQGIYFIEEIINKKIHKIINNNENTCW